MLKLNYLLIGIMIGILSILIGGNYNLVEGYSLNDIVTKHTQDNENAKHVVNISNSVKQDYQNISDKSQVHKKIIIEPFDMTSCQSSYSNLGTNGAANRLNNVMCNINDEQRQKNQL